jgi:phosphatidylinositol alpha-1,6-mannosyltransferase
MLTVGRLVSRKGIDTTLAALPALLPDFPGLTYVVAGDGPDRPRLEKLAAGLGVSGAVQFAGRVAGDRLPALFREAHLFVMPVREETAGASVEGFGIVYLEASASGLPVVAAASGGAAEAVHDGLTGLVVPPDDPQALTAALRRLLGDADLRRQMGRAGRQWVESEMNWDRAAREFAALLGAGG